MVVPGNGPTQHIHKTKDEAFYIPEEAVNIKVGEQTIEGFVSSFVLILKGTVHTFRDVGPTPAKVLVIFSSPGFEQAIVEVWGEADQKELDHATYVERIKAVTDK